MNGKSFIPFVFDVQLAKVASLNKMDVEIHMQTHLRFFYFEKIDESTVSRTIRCAALMP